MNVTEETVQTMRPQLISHGLPAIDTLNENSGICSPATSNIRRTYNTTHERASENSLGQVTSFGAEVVYYREENYKTYFEISHKNSKLQNDCKNIELSWPFLDSNPAGAKTPDAKTTATDYLARKQK